MFSKSCKYAIRSVIYLAAMSNEEKRIGIKPIAEELDIPAHFLAKILQKLARENVIHSLKGPSGGFYTTEDDVKNPLMIVVDTIDGPDVFTSCAAGLKHCSDKKPCPLHNDIAPFRNAFRDSLNTKTIKEFADTLKNEVTYLVV
ncbi:MAG: Rrf2 family transcriptional regulator [Ichthyobacteriaceae bacterium]|nr:Rrf2 family transcriptional regulator [Ichthyobacteriaceae bacterium]